MPDPQNARTDAATGTRWYRWEPEGEEPVDVLSVTSIRQACGISNNLVNWQIGNVVNAATGTRAVERIGPRGGVKKGYEADGPFPGEFTRLLLATEGNEGPLAQLRTWLKAAAEAPRDTAAMRGSVVHKAIEVEELTPDREWIEEAFKAEAARRRRLSKLVVTEDDRMFVKRTLEQYQDFRARVPSRQIAAEAQIWNLSLGYAGSADTLEHLDGDPEDENVILDYKTAAGIYTDNVLQVHGYLAGEFIGANGIVDEKLSAELAKATRGGLVHLRPDGWSLHLFPFRAEVMQAFVGSVMLARFIADWEDPKHLFSESKSGRAAA